MRVSLPPRLTGFCSAPPIVHRGTQTHALRIDTSQPTAHWDHVEWPKDKVFSKKTSCSRRQWGSAMDYWQDLSTGCAGRCPSYRAHPGGSRPVILSWQCWRMLHNTRFSMLLSSQISWLTFTPIVLSRWIKNGPSAHMECVWRSLQRPASLPPGVALLAHCTAPGKEFMVWLAFETLRWW